MLVGLWVWLLRFIKKDKLENQKWSYNVSAKLCAATKREKKATPHPQLLLGESFRAENKRCWFGGGGGINSKSVNKDYLL